MNNFFSRIQKPTPISRTALRGGYLVTLLGLLSIPLLAWTESNSYSDDQIKAVFLYHFTSFIKWPEDAFSSGDTHFRICTPETDPINKTLSVIIAGEAVNNRDIELYTLAEGDQAKSCQILYLPQGNDGHLLEQLNHGASRTLTVSDDKEFIKRGGMIKFHFERGRIRPVIHKPRLDNANLKASAKLLQLATLVSK